VPAMLTTDEIAAAHAARLAALDPLLPGAYPLPAPQPADTLLAVDGAVGVAHCERPDPESLGATWGSAEQHLLQAQVAGADPVPAMAALLARWRDQVAKDATPGQSDSEAAITWPSRDVALTPLFRGYGLAPLTLIAARLPGRPGPAGGHAVLVRPLAEPDLDAVVALNLEEARWDALFGTVTERSSTLRTLRREYEELLAMQAPLTWVAELAGRVVGVLRLSPPERAGWIAPLARPAPLAYLNCLSVTATHRGAGVGAALVATAHTALDAAGVAVTLLHYTGLNPLSGPFWHRCGYRPLWTMWQATPATRLAGNGPM
jgi:GNAT superfamily N-acetyltransferase